METCLLHEDINRQHILYMDKYILCTTIRENNIIINTAMHRWMLVSISSWNGHVRMPVLSLRLLQTYVPLHEDKNASDPYHEWYRNQHPSS